MPLRCQLRWRERPPLAVPERKQQVPDEVRRVLSNWISQSLDSIGRLEPGIVPADWVAERFLEWFRTQAGDLVGDVALATHRVRAELERLGGWKNSELGEAMHELIHIDDAVNGLKGLLVIHENE